jgi:tetratricopeptide (TPR) repeat protein
LTSYLANHPNEARANQANHALADYNYESGYYSAALGYYRDVNEKTIDPSDRMRFNYRMGFCFVQRKQYEKGKERLQKVVDSPNKYRQFGYYYYGYASLMEEQYEEAFRSFREIKDKRFEKINFYMAQVQYQRSKYNEALEQLALVSTKKVSAKKIFLNSKPSVTTESRTIINLRSFTRKFNRD